MSSYNRDFGHIPNSNFGLHAGFGDNYHRARRRAQAVTGDRAERGPGLADRRVGQANRAGAAQDEHGRSWRTGEKYPDWQAIDNLKLDGRPAVRAGGFPYQRLQG